MKKALIVGIDDYPNNPLTGCVNDARILASVLESDGDGTPNFSIRLQTDVKTKAQLKKHVRNLFEGDNEASLFYFSGHGINMETGAYLVTPDCVDDDYGMSMDELLIMANSSKVKNKIIILDCCDSGAFGSTHVTGGMQTAICEGVTILTATKSNEAAIEVNGHGVFTNLLIDALCGGAADICGNITPGSVYAYIDQALGPWEQRPVFKTNITQFMPLRKVAPTVKKETLRKITEYFLKPEVLFLLDPSFEDTNNPDIKHDYIEPYAIPDNVAIFKNLQEYESVGLVQPVDAKYMYFAAMNSKACKLTPLGWHYWRLVNRKLLL